MNIWINKIDKRKQRLTPFITAYAFEYVRVWVNQKSEKNLMNKGVQNPVHSSTIIMKYTSTWQWYLGLFTFHSTCFSIKYILYYILFISAQRLFSKRKRYYFTFKNRSIKNIFFNTIANYNSKLFKIYLNRKLNDNFHFKV